MSGYCLSHEQHYSSSICIYCPYKPIPFSEPDDEEDDWDD